ncbi:hypothetical protein LJC16_01100 [Bacteroidales bacterium OttesenSCG-928-C19]|nr:hypothetical protein [Bacteroidales bacterium OttesenSCG-928-C19]
MVRQLTLLFQDFKSFFQKDFNLKAYTYALAVIAASIFVVYATPFGKLISRAQIPTDNRIVNDILLFLFMYFVVLIPVLFIKKEQQILKKGAFWFKSILFVSVLAFSSAFSWRNVLDFPSLSSIESSFVFKVLWRSCNITIVLPVLILYRIFIDKKVKGLYGICRGNHHIKAYLSLYIIILPILIGISFTPDFKSYYPSYKPWLFGDEVFNLPTWLSTVIYETVYMSDFVMVELIFRGAMVIGMATLLGRNAVLPMVGIYVMLHFGKPVMETMSAIFGGYFLGTLAFQTKHIWGGIIIHMGIALIIELLRFSQYYILGIG